MASREQWERFLYEKYKLVATDPLNTNLKLFSVLVKKGKEGSHRILSKIGTILDLQAATDSEWEETESKIRSYLRGSLEEEDEEGIIDRNMDGYIRCKTGYASSVFIGLLKMLKIAGGRCNNLTYEAYNVSTESIDTELVGSLFCTPCWAPNLKRIQLEQPILSKKGFLELWVVSEMKFCTELAIEAGEEGSGGIGLELPAEITGSIVPIPVPVAAGVDVKNLNQKKVIAIGDKVPVGFKTIRLEYDFDGNLQSLISGGEKIRPYYRADDDEIEAFTPDTDPCYHMGGLFVDHSHQLLECLQIITPEPAS